MNELTNYVLQQYFNTSSAIAEMATQSCTIRIFAVECRIPVFNALFSVTSENINVNHILLKARFFPLHFCHRQILDNIFTCPIAIAYSMGQIIKSVCVCLSVCLSVRLRALSRSHFLIDFRQNWHRCKNPEK